MAEAYYSDIDESDVFGGLIVGDNYSPEELKEVSSNIRVFKSIFTKNVFKGAYYVAYEVITNLSKLSPRITLRQFKSQVTNSLGILINIPEVEVEDMSESDDPKDQMKDLLQVAVSKFVECQKKPTDEQSFKANLAILADRIKQNRYQEILLESYNIAKEGMRIRGKFVQGADAADKYYTSEMAVLNTMIIDGTSKAMAIQSGTDGLAEVLSNIDTLRKKDICSFHLAPMDSTIGTLKTSEMVAIFGPPKGGKSRVQANLVHDGIISGHNGCIFQLEGTPIEYLAMLESRHMMYLYGTNPVTDEVILENKIPDDWKPRYKQCKNDLFTNPKYGEFRIMPGPLYLETMEEQILEQYHSWKPFEFLVVDYPTLIMSNTNKTEREIVSSAFRRLKSLITFGVPGGMLGIIPHQMQTESFKKLKQGLDEEGSNGKKKGATLDSDGGADSSESVKSPDLVIGIFSTKEMKELNQMYMLYVAARRKKPFKDFKVRSYLGNCTLIYDETLMMQDADN